MTLREVINEFPRNSEMVITETIPKNFSELSYYDKCVCVGNSDILAIMNVKDGKAFFGIKTITVKRVGKVFFKKATWSSTIVIESNKISSNLKVADIPIFFNFINRPIVKDLNYREKAILCKKFMLRAVLCKKVYGMESFYREYMNGSYHIKNFDWRLFRDFINSNVSVSIIDLIHFTKDLHKSMKVFLGVNNDIFVDYSKSREYQDILSSAVKLNQVVDFSWSEKRLKEFHLDQTRQLMGKQIATKSQTPIYDTVINGNNIKFLNTELDVFREGYYMHHCLYTNYWSRIKNKDYIAFHMYSPEDCTFSVKLANGKLYFDQIFAIYDRPVAKGTVQVAMDFVNRNEEALIKLLQHPKENNSENLETFRLDAELPY